LHTFITQEERGGMIGGDQGASAGERSPVSSISRRRLSTVVAGGAVAGGVVGALLGIIPDEARAWQLEPVPTSSLPQVEGTLAAQQAAQLRDEARRCREPLARIAVWHSAGPGGMIIIISRGYQSPRFALTTAPSLGAFPYPAPYPTGRGVLTLVGEANDVMIALRPQYINARLTGTVPINVCGLPSRAAHEE
jgi:hypothetical protein